MRTKKEYTFDEEKEALEIIRNGFPDNVIDYAKMYTVAKYFRQKYKLGALELRRQLIKFCKKQDKNFNTVLNAESLKKWVSSAMNYNLRVIESVSISKKDIDFLKTIETEKERKALFAALILTKSFKKGSTKRKKEYKQSDNYYLRYSNLLDIVRLAELTNTTEIDMTKIIHKYKEHFTFYYPEKELIRVEFIEKNPQETFEIKNFDNILEYYYMFFGEKVEKCTICGKEYVKRSNRQKYCDECGKDVRREKQKLLMRERRKD